MTDGILGTEQQETAMQDSKVAITENRMRHALQQIRDFAATMRNGGSWAAGVAVLCLATLPDETSKTKMTGTDAGHATRNGTAGGGVSEMVERVAHAICGCGPESDCRDCEVIFYKARAAIEATRGEDKR